MHAQSEARWRCGAMFRGGYGEGGSSSDSADAYYDAVEGDEDGAVTGSAASGSGRPAIFVTAPLSGGKAARVTKIECNGGGADDETGASGDDASLLASADRREGARGTAAATLSDAEVAVIRRKSGEDDDRVAVSNFQAASGESHGHPLATLVSRGALSSPDSILSYTSGTSDEGERGSQSSLLAGSIALSLQSEGLYSDRPKKIKVRLVEKMRTEFGKLVLIQQLGSVPRVSSSGDSALPEGGSRHSRSATADLGTSTSLPSLNGSHVASSDDVGEREEGGEQRGWERGPRAIFSVKFSPDGNYLAASGEDGVIRLWKLLVEDAMAAQEEERSDGHLRDGNESDAADGGSAEGEGGRGEYRPPRMASIFRQEPVQEFRGHTGAVLDMSWSKNNFLLSASMDQSVRLWHYSRPDCLGIFRHPDFVTSVAFHPRDDRIFITGSLDCRLRLWSIAERSVRSWNELPANNFITAVSFTSSGKYALAGTTTGVCLLVETEVREGAQWGSSCAAATRAHPDTPLAPHRAFATLPRFTCTRREAGTRLAKRSAASRRCQASRVRKRFSSAQMTAGCACTRYGTRRSSQSLSGTRMTLRRSVPRSATTASTLSLALRTTRCSSGAWRIGTGRRASLAAFPPPRPRSG